MSGVRASHAASLPGDRISLASAHGHDHRRMELILLGVGLAIIAGAIAIPILSTSSKSLPSGLTDKNKPLHSN
jgi:hypothetical protein